MKHTLTMRTPTSWHNDMWREGAPCGNGRIGALVYGGAAIEKITFNHTHLWKGGTNPTLPDVSDCLPRIRALLKEHNTIEANKVLTTALREAGYAPKASAAFPMCDLTLETEIQEPVSGYRRVVDMEKAEVTVSWRQYEKKFTRSIFVSRADDTVYTRYTAAGGKLHVTMGLEVHDTETLQDKSFLTDTESGSDVLGDGMGRLTFAGSNETVYAPADGDYGGVCLVRTDGTVAKTGNRLAITGATWILTSLKLFVGGSRAVDLPKLWDSMDKEIDYEAALAAHIALHEPLFNGVNFSLTGNISEISNEELLLSVFDGEHSPAFVEKMYAYGRYLFICATGDKDTLPCHLTGLWNGNYAGWWVIFMYNINFEMIYWQAATGNLLPFLRLALDYTEAQLPALRENAAKLFGCRGIYIDSVNTPESGLLKCLANHIANWTGGAAWFSQHFWDYWRFSGDETYLRDHALPFMAEAALFYEDFLTPEEDGYLHISPSVSPENAPGNIQRVYGDSVEVARDAVMDIALVKELLTNLLTGSERTGLYAEKRDTWREILAKLPPYTVNDDGGIHEWNDHFYEDNDRHRHQSHLYPVFPGCELREGDPLWDNFVRAEELRWERGLSQMSSWGMVNMAATFARMGQGDRARQVLETVGQTCVMNNFFTVHNDWRRMGPVMCRDMRSAPYQIDANIGFPAAVNEMLLQSQHDDVALLPALPSDWKCGKMEGLLARGGIVVSIHWSETEAVVRFGCSSPVTKEVRIGSGFAFADGSRVQAIEIHDQLELRFRR